MNDNNSLQTKDYYKNLNKHGSCSKCNIVLTQDNYKKRRTVCKLRYNNYVLRYYKSKFGANSCSKTDVGTQTDLSDEQERLIKQKFQTKKLDLINKVFLITKII